MDLWTAATALARRWYVVLPALALTVVLALRAADTVEPTYSAAASVLVVQTAPGENPYASFSASVTITARALATAATGDEFAARVREEGGAGSYAVEVQQDAPLLSVTTTSGSADDAIALLSIVVAGIDEDLGARQTAAGVTNEVRLDADVLDMPAAAREQSTQRTRTLLGVLGLGFAGSIAAAFMVDSIVSGRGRALRVAHEGGPPSHSRAA
jgi:capsular polysaccharide biosynthesis protein